MSVANVLLTLYAVIVTVLLIIAVMAFNNLNKAFNICEAALKSFKNQLANMNTESEGKSLGWKSK